MYWGLAMVLLQWPVMEIMEVAILGDGHAFVLLWFTHIEVCFAYLKKAILLVPTLIAHQLFLKDSIWRKCSQANLYILAYSHGWHSWSWFLADIDVSEE